MKNQSVPVKLAPVAPAHLVVRTHLKAGRKVFDRPGGGCAPVFSTKP